MKYSEKLFEKNTKFVATHNVTPRYFHIMLSRRHLRMKALQALYAFFQSHNDDLASGEKQLLLSNEKIYELFVWILSLIVEVKDLAMNRIEDGRHKFFPTQEDLNPNMRFVENRFIRQLEANKFYQRRLAAYKISWADEPNLIIKLYNDIRASSLYEKYMNAGQSSYADDKRVVEQIVVEILPDFTPLSQFFEDRSIFWSEGDFEIALYIAQKTVKVFRYSWNEDQPLPPLYKSDAEGDDREFLLSLYRKAVLFSQEYEDMIGNKAKNWEAERIAVIDMIILKMALVEILEFPSIPLKVTMNEYIELSKAFSSEKSRTFVNGMLDKMILQLKEENKIKKVGRGLLDH